ncbi:hypothetical protein ACQZV8_07490 [Magnetococcales bacterium HHB-1]
MIGINTNQTPNIESIIWHHSQSSQPGRLQPEVEVWAAVLKRAALDLKGFIKLARTDASLWELPDFRSEAQGLIDFFLMPSYDVGGFGFICSILNTTPEALKENKVTKRIQELKRLMQAYDATATAH